MVNVDINVSHSFFYSTSLDELIYNTRIVKSINSEYIVFQSNDIIAIVITQFVSDHEPANTVTHTLHFGFSPLKHRRPRPILAILFTSFGFLHQATFKLFCFQLMWFEHTR